MAVQRIFTSVLLAAVLLATGARVSSAWITADIVGETYYVADHGGNPSTDRAFVSFDASGSHGSGTLTYSWSGDFDMVTDGAKCTGWATVGDHYLALYVENEYGDADWIELTFTVDPQNNTPVAHAGPDQTIYAPDGAWVTLNGSASDADGDVLQYDWFLNGEAVALGQQMPTLFLEPGVHIFDLWVYDPYFEYFYEAGHDTVAITVTDTPMQIISLSKTTLNVGEFPASITVNGVGFLKGAVVTWNGEPMPTTYLSSSQLRAKVSEEQVALGGVFRLNVVNPDGMVSNGADFTVLNRTPSIASLSPNWVMHGSEGFTLEVIGARFAPGAVIWWRGAPRATIFNSPTSVTMFVPNTYIKTPMTLKVQVVNPGPGGGPSNVKTFTIR